MLLLTSAVRHPAWQHKSAVAAVAGTRQVWAFAAAAAAALAQKHTSQHDNSSKSGGAIAAAAAAAAAVAAAAALGLPHPAHAEADDTGSSSSSSNVRAAQQSRLANWLNRHGADLSAVSVQPSEVSCSGLPSNTNCTPMSSVTLVLKQQLPLSGA